MAQNDALRRRRREESSFNVRRVGHAASAIFPFPQPTSATNVPFPQFIKQNFATLGQAL